MWILKWDLSWHASANCCPHSVHWWGFSPVWIRMCLENCVANYGIVHFDGMYLFLSAWNMKFPELWNEYLFSCCGVWNFFPQLSQVWFRMSMCEKRSCRNLWPVLLNCFPHKEHMCFPLFSSLFRWFLQCLLRSSLRMKLLPHSSHVYGLWFKCRYLSWTSNAVELEKT